VSNFDRQRLTATITENALVLELEISERLLDKVETNQFVQIAGRVDSVSSFLTPVPHVLGSRGALYPGAHLNRCEDVSHRHSALPAICDQRSNSLNFFSFSPLLSKANNSNRRGILGMSTREKRRDIIHLISLSSPPFN
jgi:hypothetical protein